MDYDAYYQVEHFTKLIHFSKLMHFTKLMHLIKLNLSLHLYIGNWYAFSKGFKGFTPLITPSHESLCELSQIQI